MKSINLHIVHALWISIVILMFIAIIFSSYSLQLDIKDTEINILRAQIKSLTADNIQLDELNVTADITIIKFQEDVNDLTTQVSNLIASNAVLSDQLCDAIDRNTDIISILSLYEIEDHIIAENYLVKLAQLYAQYPYATEVYIRLRLAGYSDAVTCGILGNMMVECAYGNLTLYPYLTATYDGINYYGLCMWCESYHPNVQQLSIYDQITYLISDIPRIFDSQYEIFCACTDPAIAALMFAEIYERPGPASYSTRQNCARIAYQTYPQ